VTSSLDTLLARTTRALDLPPPAALAGSGDGALPSAYAVTDLAAASAAARWRGALVCSRIQPSQVA
jgi:hypothetical protein